MLASFLLHLSLLDAPLSRDTPPTLLATGALSAALDAYGFDPWPACVEARSPLLRREVDAVVAALRAAQAGTAARQLRTLWCALRARSRGARGLVAATRGSNDNPMGCFAGLPALTHAISQ